MVLPFTEDPDIYTNLSFWDQHSNELWNITDDFSISLTNATNSNETDNQMNSTVKTIYLIMVPTLVTICILSVAINIRILISICWIRKKLSPTLHISLSLAGADAYTSFVLGIGLVLNSLLPTAFGVQFQTQCFNLFLETQRISGVIISVVHLLALACNHYLGILRPFHYLSIMTRRTTTICIVLLWILPIIYFVVYFASVEGQGFQSKDCEVFDFGKQLKFRSIFSLMFFIPLALMIGIYLHIFSIVREHQKQRNRFSQVQQGSRHRNNASNADNTEHQQIVKNVKAIYTTLMILGSFVIGWMPAVITYLLICDDCIFQLKTFTKIDRLIIFTIPNLLIILKTLLNPIIYAARMQEIKKAIPKMQAYLCRWCCTFHIDGDIDSSERSMHRMSQYYSSNNNHMLRSNTMIHRIHSCPTSASNDTTYDYLQRRSTRNHRRRREESSTEL